MPNFIFAIVTIVYALVCLANESDQENCSTLESSGDSFKKKDAKGSAEKLLEILREKVAKG
ncbi:MAG: hypothetical protein KJP23_16380 [Deltaproteobacteria bacterium]|nr:hypothetical protein [Deltaproteobacteria bacterium]